MKAALDRWDKLLVPQCHMMLIKSHSDNKGQPVGLLVLAWGTYYILYFMQIYRAVTTAKLCIVSFIWYLKSH